ncbi:SMI1/KNR4 family protein [Pseudomonas syringae pv. syringae]|uniref:SMI1/KNR4 family protein n=1 Tax=Pseudomonas syringae TaxID=317 RepID=UPI00234175E3|nr:SMI1/KNR4 family protein [Pseudomonas syringae]MDC3744213.1 SMI1/KNR4 family protein [Pseudomonas syringae pv. syringae]
MLIPLIDSAQQISDADIENVEKEIGGKFPSDFKNMYLSINGGNIDDSDESNSLLLAGFVPMKYGQIPMEQAYRELVEDFPTLKGKVPFAFDEGGNYFLLSVFGHDQGEIGLWIMDTEEYHIVSDSFSEFLTRLHT